MHRRHYHRNAIPSSPVPSPPGSEPGEVNAIELLRAFDSAMNPTKPIRPSPLTMQDGIQLDLLNRLRSFPLFQSAPESFLTTILSHLRPAFYSPRDYIITEGDEARAMYWVVRGAVAVTSRDGESTYAELRAGAFFGEIGVSMNIPRTATIIARTKCLLVVLSKEDLHRELPKFPEVERTIRDEAEERLMMLKKKKEERKTSPSGIKRPAPISDDDQMEDAQEINNNDYHQNRLHGAQKNMSKFVPEGQSSAIGNGQVCIRPLLKELPLFANLSSEILHFLGLSAQPRTYPPFTTILQQDSTGRDIFFIVRGEVEVVDENHLDPSKTTVKARLRKGQYFGEVAGLSLAPRRTATVRSVTHVECLVIEGDTLGELWKKCPSEMQQQVEATARTRLDAGCTPDLENIIMLDASTPTMSIEELDISELHAPQLTITRSQSPLKQPGPSDPSIVEPFDPDPYLPMDFDESSARSMSRRGSLAPPPPQTTPPSSTSSSQSSTPTHSSQPSPSYPSSSLAPPRQEESHRDHNLYSFLSPSLTPSQSPSKNKHVSGCSAEHPGAKRPKIAQKLPRFNKGHFNDDILIKIFINMELHDLVRLRRVSTHWSKLLTTSPCLLKVLDLKPYNRVITDAVLVNYIAPFVGHRPHTVDISNCFHISDEGFMHLAQHCGANVKSWKMKSVWDVTGQAILEMANKAKELEEIDLSNCRKVSDTLLARVVGWVVPDFHAMYLNQQQQYLNHQAAIAAAAATTTTAAAGGGAEANGTPTVTNSFYGNPSPYMAAPLLSPLNLPSLPPPPQPIPPHIAANQPPPGTVIGCPNLRKLTLSYCKHVTDRTMAHLALHAAKRLEHVDLTRCTTITDQGFQSWSMVRFERLTSLCLADCTYLTDSAIVFLTNAAKGLRMLDLSFCCALSDIATEVLSLGCPHLTHLKLSFCGSAVSDSSLRSISLHLLELQELSVRGCVRVTGVGVEAIVEGCHNLELFDVSQCKNLARWLDAGGVERCRMIWKRNLRFELVAGEVHAGERKR